MNIGRISQIAGAYQPKPVKQAPQKSGGAAKNGAVISEVSISSEGKLFEYAKRRAAELPDIREDKTAAVAKKFENGKYNVSAAVVAQKIMETGA